MNKVTRLQDIEVYQDALSLTQLIFILCKHRLLKHEFELINQIKRASMSVCANIAEGYGRYSRKDFANFLSISLGSCNETIAFLDIIHLMFPQLEVMNIQDRYITLSKRLYTFRNKLVS